MSMPYNPAFRRAVRASRAAVVSEPPSGTPRGRTTMPPRPRSLTPTGLTDTHALAAASALAATAAHLCPPPRLGPRRDARTRRHRLRAASGRHQRGVGDLGG